MIRKGIHFTRRGIAFALKGAGITVLVIVLFLLSTGDTLRLSATEKKATPFLYDLVRWEANNFLDKWWRRSLDLFPGVGVSKEESQAMVEEFFRLNEQIRRLDAELEHAVALSPAQRQRSLREIQRERDQLHRRRKAIRPRVEERLEGLIAAAVEEEGIPFALGPFQFPPVDFTFQPQPKLLVTSRRDVIGRLENILLDPDITVDEMEELEDSILEDQNLAALVLDIGGVATYPAIISPNSSLERALNLASHEWLHQFLFFRPLGQHILDSRRMFTLNETTANIWGQEIGARLYERITGQKAVREGPPPSEKEVGEGTGEGDGAFDFRREMQETRRRVDELLGQGKVVEAEDYMEQRRQLFVANGFPIRKLNQAFFAFEGTYADSPASVSPIDRELRELRRLSPSLGAFIRTVSGVSSYAKFKAILEEKRLEAMQRGERQPAVGESLR